GSLSSQIKHSPGNPGRFKMFSIRYFKKGSAHITFRKPELVDRLNDIIAKYYPETLSPV
ncbi:DUF4942 domain-containing protein, partial [Escherichia coli]|nr:DUF4942 domain-containing protein [Escherichia coli]